MTKKLFFLCLIVAFFYSCSLTGVDKGQIKELVEHWTKADPNSIGGPYEMREIKEVQNIEVGEITESKWAKMGCNDCKQSVVTLTCVDKAGNQQIINYQLRKMDGKWAITEWEIQGKDKGNFYPNIDEEVIEARGELK